MLTSMPATELSDLHMIVLGRIAHRAMADVDDIAGWLTVPVAVGRGPLRGSGSRGPCHYRPRSLISSGAGAAVGEGSILVATT